MKSQILLKEEELIQKAVQILSKTLGPVETSRFLSIHFNKRKDSLKRHYDWQKALKKKAFFDEIFK